MRDPLAHRVEVSPAETALIDAATGRSWDVEALDRSVDRTASRLCALGVAAGDRVALVLPNRPASAVAIHAVLRIGATLVPLGDGLTPPELRDRIDRVAPTAVVCDATTEPTVVEATNRPVVSVDEPTTDDVTALTAADDGAAVPGHEWTPDATAVMLFTSGTTGDPKPVILTPTNLLASAGASALRLGFAVDDRWLVTLGFHHAGGLSPLLRMPLYGSTVVLRRSFDPGPAVDDVAAYDVTCVSLVPTMLRRMLDARGTLPDSLRVVLLGGAPAPTDLIERCRDYSVPVYPTYGTTETASQVATATPAEAFADPDTVGRPLFGTDVRVMDETGAERPPGEPGELVVSGPTVSPGYHGMPEATAAAFAPDGFHTGDVGVVDEQGRVRIVGRLDDRIVTGGETVDPGEVVAALREHPAVADAAVVGIPDEEWGERVAALAVPDGEPPDRDALEEHCRERLAGFKLPRTVGFADDLPRTASGTVDREAVRERLERIAERAAVDADEGEVEGEADEGEVEGEADEGETEGRDRMADEAGENDEDGENDEGDADGGGDGDADGRGDGETGDDAGTATGGEGDEEDGNGVEGTGPGDGDPTANGGGRDDGGTARDDATAPEAERVDGSDGKRDDTVDGGANDDATAAGEHADATDDGDEDVSNPPGADEGDPPRRDDDGSARTDDGGAK